MNRSTATRKIVTSMIAAAVMVQSIVVADQTPCMCSTTGACATGQDSSSVKSDSECVCSEKARDDKSCCCSSSKCCQEKPADHDCQCGCSDQRPEPPVPADTVPQSVSWELILESLSCTAGIVQPEVQSDSACSFAVNDQRPQSCSVQTLYCTWLT